MATIRKLKNTIALLKDENEMLYQLLKEKSYRLEVICNNSDFYLVINDDAWFKINKELADNLSDFLKKENENEI